MQAICVNVSSGNVVTDGPRDPPAAPDGTPPVYNGNVTVVWDDGVVTTQNQLRVALRRIAFLMLGDVSIPG